MCASVLLRLLVVGVAIWLPSRSLRLRAADGAADPEMELRRKAEEVEKLKEELNRAQSDLKKLEVENQRLRTEKTNAPPASTPPATTVAPAKPVPAVATLPPLESGAVVDAADLTEHFRADPAKAGERYRKKTFRVKGEVTRFGAKILVRYYEVILQTPEKSATVVCTFNYLDRYRAVYTKDSGEVLVGVVGERTEIPLLKVGDRVEIEGTCEGLDGRKIAFHRCRVVK